MKRVFLFTLWIFWMGFIFYLSSIPDLKSALPSWQDFIFRKIAHIAEYAILWILTWNIFEQKTGRGGQLTAPTMWVFLFTILFAISDEIHQSMVPLRHFAITDILIDTFGMVLGYTMRKKFF